jgi:hypothetical protein
MPSPSDLSSFAFALARSHTLSPAGHARRARMRDDLIAAVVRRRRLRRAARVGSLALVLASAAALLWPSPARPAAPADTFTHFTFARVHDAPARVASWRVSGAPSADVIRTADALWTQLEFAAVPTRAVPREVFANDAQILQLLAQAERPTGLVRSAAGVFFTADVVDATLDAP